MEKSSRRLRRQIREKMSSDMATGCLLRGTEACSETRRSCAGLTGSPVCKQALPLTTPIPALLKWQPEGRWLQGTPGLPGQRPPPLWGPGPGQASARSMGSVQRTCFNPPTPVPLSIHGAGFTLGEGGGLSSPVPTPLETKQKPHPTRQEMVTGGFFLCHLARTKQISEGGTGRGSSLPVLPVDQCPP